MLRNLPKGDSDTHFATAAGLLGLDHPIKIPGRIAGSVGFLVAPWLTGCLLAWEQFWWYRRRLLRREKYEEAEARAKELGRPLVVVGDPKGGVTHDDYGCGDLTIDLEGVVDCPNGIASDISESGSIPLGDDSAVVYVSCVLEYVADFEAAVEEILRVAGSPENVFVVRVEPWTLASRFYPGARRALEPHGLESANEFLVPLSSLYGD